MDLIKFNPAPGTPTLLTNAEVINNTKSVMWIERYRANGEFTVVTSPDSGVREALPIGAFVSHMKTSEVMVVENHEISETNESETQVTISGRSFEVLLDQRIVGSNRVYDPTYGAARIDYTLAAGRTWAQAVSLTQAHISNPGLVDPNDQIPNVVIFSQATVLGESVERVIKKGPLYKEVIDILSVDNLGIRSYRPGPWSPAVGVDSSKIAMVVYEGANLSKDVVFSYDSGEVSNAQYLWSDKALKTSVVLISTNYETVVHGTENLSERKTMYLDVSDIDEKLGDPAGHNEAAKFSIIGLMKTRGRQALADQNKIEVSNIGVSKENTRYNYRQDFNVGDIVAVDANYNTTRNMRVTEYVEIEDENGETSYPTLSGLEQ